MKHTHRKSRLFGDVLAVTATLGLVGAGVAALTVKAEANGPGVCIAAIGAIGGDSYYECRDQGWTITRHIVVSPAGIVRVLDMPGCETEDGGPLPCYWDGDTMGNGHGRSFFVSRAGVVHYVVGLGRHVLVP